MILHNSRFSINYNFDLLLIVDFVPTLSGPMAMKT